MDVSQCLVTTEERAGFFRYRGDFLGEKAELQARLLIESSRPYHDSV